MTFRRRKHELWALEAEKTASHEWNPIPLSRFYGALCFGKPCLRTTREFLMSGKMTLEQEWRQQSEAAQAEAEKLPHGREREALVRKARQLKTASHINQWLSSPELEPPK